MSREAGLVIDGYTGYNRVTDVDDRARAGCIAQVRRKTFDALPTAPTEARRGLELILDVYRVEHEAKALEIVRTPQHLAMRQTRSRTAMDHLHEWLLDEQPKHLHAGQRPAAFVVEGLVLAEIGDFAPESRTAGQPPTACASRTRNAFIGSAW